MKILIVILIVLNFNCMASDSTPGGGYEAVEYGDVITDDGDVIPPDACDVDPDLEDCENLDPCDVDSDLCDE